MNLKHEELKEIIHHSLTEWDINPMTKTFAILLSRAIIKADKVREQKTEIMHNQKLKQ
jgi:hypothetical protein